MHELLDLAVAAAREAGVLLRDRFAGPRTGVGVKSSGTDMVSDADRAAEETILACLRAARPDDAVLGEESGETSGTSGLLWIVDPLDGTTNFLYGIPQWCVSIACEDREGLLVGVVHDPLRGETFAAARGRGATLDGRPARVSGAADLATALLASGFSYLADERAVQAEMLARVLPRVRDVRRAGSAALDLAWTAAGRFDGFYEVPIQRWDWAAGALLVREAGGLVRELPAIGPSGPGVVASGPALFSALAGLVSASLAGSREDGAGR